MTFETDLFVNFRLLWPCILVSLSSTYDLFVFHGGMNNTLVGYLPAFRASEFKRRGSDFMLVKRSLVYRSIWAPRQ